MIALLVGLVLAAPAENPHGRDDACTACHDHNPDGSRGAPRVTAASCRTCHPTADMHPVGMRPVHVTVAAGWPLENGTITCATCHAEPSCGPGRMQEPPYWRGGPAAKVQDFCYRCHERETYQRTSPHDLADKSSCAACHIGGDDEAELRVEPVALCAECHAGPHHAGVAAHLGQTVTEHGRLRLVDGKIACVSCHDVHTEATAVASPSRRLGDALRERALQIDWAGATIEGDWPGHDASAMLAAPVEDGSLCRLCHGVGP